MAYYVCGLGGTGKFYYGRVVFDMLSALILLDEARHAEPGEEWGILTKKI